MMTELICESMNDWLHPRCIVPPQGHTQDDPIMHALTIAFHSQKRIGWDQFFCGQLSTDWTKVIAIYYCDRCPGNAFTPEQWIWTTIDALWTFSMTLWHQRCAYYHGVNGIITLEWKQKATALHTMDIYHQTISNVTPMDNIILHWHSVTTILNWMKQHLDAYLATTEVICKWNVKARWTFMDQPFLSCTASLYRVWGRSHIK